LAADLLNFTILITIFTGNLKKGLMSESEFINKMLPVVDNKLDQETFCKIYSEIFTSEWTDVASYCPVLKKELQIISAFKIQIPIHRSMMAAVNF